jgi:acyl carrier protein phosphodiesterase
MNLLAHAFLSPPDAPAGILVGNLSADWIKGKVRHALPDDFRAGVALHRRIDAFTDSHPLVEKCAGLLEPRWNRYAAVLVDMLFDHVLSVRWTEYGRTSRRVFIAATYHTLQNHVHILPPRARHASAFLIADDWFNCYATLDGVALCLTQLSRRLNHDIDLAPAVADFRAHETAFHEAFTEFFPALRRHVEAVPLHPLHYAQ